MRRHLTSPAKVNSKTHLLSDPSRSLTSTVVAAAGGLLAAEAAITKDKVTNLPGFGAPMTDTYSGCKCVC